MTRNRIFCSSVKFSKVLKENDIDINFSEHDEKYYTTNGMYCIKVVYSSHVGRVSAVAGKLLMTRRKSKTMPALQSIYEMDKPCNFSCFFILHFTVMTNVSSAVWVWRVVSTSEDGVVQTILLFVLSNVGEGGGGSFPIQILSLEFFVFKTEFYILDFGHNFGHIWSYLVLFGHIWSYLVIYENCHDF